MYPSGELTSLSRRKALLRAKISIGRLECAALAAEAVRPIDWIDRVVAQWKKIAPIAKFAAVPLGLLLQRGLLPGKKLKLFGRVARLLPWILGAAKFFKARQRA
jgi:hypothetical protein